MPRVKVGDLVSLKFWDHSDGDEAFLFRAFGRIVRIEPEFYVLRTWEYADPRHEAEDIKSGAFAENVDDFAIVRSTIREIKKLRETR